MHCGRGACWGSRVAGNCLCGCVGCMPGGGLSCPPPDPAAQTTPSPSKAIDGVSVESFAKLPRLNPRVQDHFHRAHVFPFPQGPSFLSVTSFPPRFPRPPFIFPDHYSEVLPLYSSHSGLGLLGYDFLCILYAIDSIL